MRISARLRTNPGDIFLIRMLPRKIEQRSINPAPMGNARVAIGLEVTRIEFMGTIIAIITEKKSPIKRALMVKPFWEGAILFSERLLFI